MPGVEDGTRETGTFSVEAVGLARRHRSLSPSPPGRPGSPRRFRAGGAGLILRVSAVCVRGIDWLTPTVRRWSRFWPHLCTVLFLVAVGWMIGRHEMWRDEIQAWLIARDAATPLAVLRQTRYEGHPWLWHLLLWIPSRFTAHPAAMQGVHLLLAGATAFVILRWAPFPPLIRLLLVGGYFFAYEWAVIARNYGISALLFCVAAALHARRWRNAHWLGLTLAAASLTNVHSIILALVLAPALAVEYAVAYAGNHRGARAVLPRALLGLALAAAGIGTGIRAVRPPADTGFAVAWHVQWSPARVAETADRVIRAYAPLPVDQPHFWNSNRLLAEGARPPEERPAWGVPPERRTAVAGWILLAGALFLWRRPWPAVPFAVGSIGLLVFFYVKYMGAVRHHGFLFLWFVVSLWMSRQIEPWHLPWPRIDAALAWWDRRQVWLLAPLLALHVSSASVAWRRDATTVFSQGRAAAAYLAAQYTPPEHYVWAGHPSPHASTVVGYLQRPRIYYLDRADFGSYVIWDHARLTPGHDAALLTRLRELRTRAPGPLVFISGRRLSSGLVRRAQLRLRARFEDSISGESYFIYDDVETES